MKLTIYKDATFCEVREVRECARVKIPYRVGQYVVKMIQGLDLADNVNVLQKALGAEEQITAVVQATFGLADEDLDNVDLMELAELAKQIVAFVVGKMSDLGVNIGDGSPNPKTLATTA